MILVDDAPNRRLDGRGNAGPPSFIVSLPLISTRPKAPLTKQIQPMLLPRQVAMRCQVAKNPLRHVDVVIREQPAAALPPQRPVDIADMLRLELVDEHVPAGRDKS